jgi:endonuclease/exonuclease/phosphatase family metal-dependent hydrolase
LTRFPILEKTNTHYQMLQEHERRGLLSVVLEIGGRKVLFMNTHFDYHRDDAERALNVKQIKERLDAHPNTAAILCGDFNGGPGSSVYKRLNELFIDSWVKAGQGKGHTFPSGTPTRRLDYIWISKGVTAKKMWVPKSEASDHLPLVGEFGLE